MMVFIPPVITGRNDHERLESLIRAFSELTNQLNTAFSMENKKIEEIVKDGKEK